MQRRMSFFCGVISGVLGLTLVGFLVNRTGYRVATAEDRNESQGSNPASITLADDQQLEQLVNELQQLKQSVARIERTILEMRKARDQVRLPESPVPRQNDPAPVSALPAEKQTPSEDEPAPPQYTIAPLAQFNQMIREIEKRIATLQARGEADAAAQLAERLASFRNDERGEYRVTSKTAELHMVGLYEASSAHHAIAPAAVRVTYTGAPIILALSSYEPVEWNIELAEGVTLERVIVSGYYQQSVKGLPNNIPVTNESRNSGGRSGFYAYSRSHEGFQQATQTLHELTGRHLQTFQGTYRYPGKPFLIGPENSDWRLQHLIARMAPLHAEATREARDQARSTFGSLRFQAMNLSGANRYGHGGQAAWGEFTANGPVLKTMRSLPTAYAHVAVDTQSDKWYAISGHGVVRFDPKTGDARAFTLESDLPELSWPCGLTFDAKRQRLLLCSLGGEGFLYAFDVATEKWSLVSSMHNVDAIVLAWSEEHDALFAISSEHGEERGQLVLRKMTPTGASVWAKPIGHSFTTLGHLPRCQLIPVKDRLVLLAPGEGRGEQLHAPPTHSFVINSETAAVEYSAKLEPQ